MKFTLVTATNPSLLGKSYSLNADGTLEKKVNGILIEGLAETREVSNIAEFMELRATLGPHQALTYGISEHKKARVYTKKVLANGVPVGDLPCISRCGADLRYENLQPGILPFDYDPVPGLPALTPDEFRTVLYGAYPALQDAPHATVPSAGSCIYRVGAKEPEKGITGQRMYVAVKDAGDIPRAGRLLHQRLMLAGNAAIVVTENGNLLSKSPIDTSLFESSHLDFTRSACGDGLEQRLPVAQSFNPDAAPLDTSKIKELSKAEMKRLDELIARLKVGKADEACRKQAAWEQQQVKSRLASVPDAEKPAEEERIRHELKALREKKQLGPDFLLHFDREQTPVTVREVLARLSDYAGQYLLDPEEPEYDGGRAVCWIKRDDKTKKAHIFSHAHGTGWKYVLVDDEQWEQARQIREGGALLVDLREEDKPKLYQPSEGARKLLPLMTEMGLGYDGVRGEWLRYDKGQGIWVTDPAVAQWNQVEEAIHQQTAGLGYTSWYVEELMKFLKGKLEAVAGDAEKTKGLLPMRNGVLRLEDKELIPHSPNYGFTWRLPFDYDPTVTCEPVKTWMLDAAGNDQSVVFILQAYINAVVIGRPDLQKYLELVGFGGSGKGTFIRLVESLVGDHNLHATTFKALEGNQFETAALYGKRLVTIADAEKWNGGVDTFKALTGQDSLRYEAKHKQQKGGKYVYQGMIIIAANSEIKSNDNTSGLQRRRIAIRFSKVVGNTVKRELNKEFAPFLPGVLNWVLELSQEEVTRRLQRTEEVSQTVQATQRGYLVTTNAIAAWADDHLVAGTEAKSPVNRGDRPLYASYKDFCETNNRGSALSVQGFSSGLLDLLVAQLKLDRVKKGRDMRGAYFEGVRLRRIPDDTFTPTLVTGETYEESSIKTEDLEVVKPENVRVRLMVGARELAEKLNGLHDAERERLMKLWMADTSREENDLRMKAGLTLETPDVFSTIHTALKSVGLAPTRLN